MKTYFVDYNFKNKDTTAWIGYSVEATNKSEAIINAIFEYFKSEYGTKLDKKDFLKKFYQLRNKKGFKVFVNRFTIKKKKPLTKSL